MKLLGYENLLKSGVVANNRMNRGRRCSGKNSYERELPFNPVDFLKERMRQGKKVAWLDVGCGEGRALIEAAEKLTEYELANDSVGGFRITGIDLAGMFETVAHESNNLRMLESSIEDFVTNEKFDLVTAVHSLHYLGDKLSIIRKAALSLKENGVFMASLDLRNLKTVRNGKSSRIFAAFLRKQGFTVDSKKHLISLSGYREFEIPFEYAGADDQAGPNYTGQPAIDSYYHI